METPIEANKNVVDSRIPNVDGNVASKGKFGSLFADNQFLSGGAILMAAGSVAALAKVGISRATKELKRLLLVNLEISSNDKSYGWFLQWMSKYNNIRAHDLAVETTYNQHSNGQIDSGFKLVPGPGRHFLKYKNCWFKVERERSQKIVDLSTGSPWETTTITTLSRDRSILYDILSEAQSYALKAQIGKTVLYTAWGTEWRTFGLPRTRRSLHSVILDGDLNSTLLQDIKSFLKSKAWYLERGIPYRRGYLLYGPPGSGKTSFIFALCGEIEYSICVLNLSERSLSNDKLNFLMSNLPERSVLLLEDIDAAFSGRFQKPSEQRSNISFSGLLNALDGVMSSEERLIFMTTNHIERLDSALIRPGRVDRQEFFGNATRYQIILMFNRFYENSQEKAEQFADSLQSFGAEGLVSTAMLQGLFVFNKDDPDAAIKMAPELARQAQEQAANK